MKVVERLYHHVKENILFFFLLTEHTYSCQKGACWPFWASPF
jgi:hypothetical protein